MNPCMKPDPSDPKVTCGFPAQHEGRCSWGDQTLRTIYEEILAAIRKKDGARYQRAVGGMLTWFDEMELLPLLDMTGPELRDLLRLAAKETRRARRTAAVERFQPPTLEEVRAYCLERKSVVDPEVFTDYYIAKGWKMGRSPMLNWQAAVRIWERRTVAEGVR